MDSQAKPAVIFSFRYLESIGFVVILIELCFFKVEGFVYVVRRVQGELINVSVNGVTLTFMVVNQREVEPYETLLTGRK